MTSFERLRLKPNDQAVKDLGYRVEKFTASLAMNRASVSKRFVGVPRIRWTPRHRGL
jgi:hypothetical protein